jgi:hypothetical protein
MAEAPTRRITAPCHCFLTEWQTSKFSTDINVIQLRHARLAEFAARRKFSGTTLKTALVPNRT